jgi:hypothetical protein
LFSKSSVNHLPADFEAPRSAARRGKTLMTP